MVDLGAGSGRSTLALAERARLVIGVDSEAAMSSRGAAAAARLEIRNVAFILGDAAALPLVDRCADLVTAFTGPSGTAESLRILRPGGEIVRVDIPNGFYGGDLNSVIAQDTPDLEEGEGRLLGEGYRAFDFDSIQEYGSTANIVRTYGFIFGRRAIDHLRRTGRTSIRWRFRVHHLRKPV